MNSPFVILGTVVGIVLILIVVGLILKYRNPKTPIEKPLTEEDALTNSSQKSKSQPETVSTEVVAVIVSAIQMYRQQEGNTNGFRITKVRSSHIDAREKWRLAGLIGEENL